MQFARFIFSGVANTAITYGLYLLLLPVFGYFAAYSSAYLAGILLSYWLNSVFVFRRPMSWRGLARFPLVYVVQYVSTALLLALFIGTFGISERIALLAAIAVTVPITFLTARIVIVPRDGS